MENENENFNKLPLKIKNAIKMYASESAMNHLTLFNSIKNSTGSIQSLSKIFKIPEIVISAIKEV